jgi:S-adenosylmethionine:tRNA-ribosyltransferase-isomerase (queuine synthetase)
MNYAKSDFNYLLPEHLIAQKPLADRVASRLLCMSKSTGVITDQNFVDFVDLLNENDLLILNDTKVIPARLFGKKQTGGKVELLIERVIDAEYAVAHIRASKSPKANSLIMLDNGFVCEVIGRDYDLFKLRFKGPQSVLEILEQVGHIPLPPYITRADDADDFTRYQTVFAKQPGAVAAPTAGLHFDQATINKIDTKRRLQSFCDIACG